MDHYDALSLTSILLVSFFVLAIGILVIVAQWRIYEKAGQPGWGCLIPVLNFYFLLKIVGKPTWWVVWIFVPLANFIVPVWVTNLLSKSFGKGVAFTLGLIFLPVIFYPILGFGKAQYLGPAGKPKVIEINV